MGILSSIIWLPIFFGFLLLSLNLFLHDKIMKYASLLFSAIVLAMIFKLVYVFDINASSYQFIENYAWLPNFNINYLLGLDGYSLLLVLLTAIMTFTVIVNNFSKTKFVAAFFIMQGLINGLFFSLDSILFYVFFEAMMLPLFIIIGYWGHENRIYATFKFILYTFVGSLFFLIAIIYLYDVTGTSSIVNMQKATLSLTQQKWIFWAMMAAFAVKVPMLPVHTWLPDAHTQAPTGGSVMLAAITLKVGAFGMLRFVLPIVPAACLYYADVIIALSLLAIIYIGFTTIVQVNLKRLIAYSSIAHMGFVTLGFFVAVKIAADPMSSTLSVNGAFLQMISHGLISGGLFFVVGSLYKRVGSLQIRDYSGVVKTMPLLASFMMLFSIANVGMPATAGFVGEFMVITASIKLNFWITFAAASALVLAASYTLWMYKKVFFGAVTNLKIEKINDINLPEALVYTVLAVLIILFGIWPNLVLQYINLSTKQLVSQLCTALC